MTLLLLTGCCYLLQLLSIDTISDYILKYNQFLPMTVRIYGQYVPLFVRQFLKKGKVIKFQRKVIFTAAVTHNIGTGVVEFDITHYPTKRQFGMIFRVIVHILLYPAGVFSSINITYSFHVSISF